MIPLACKAPTYLSFYPAFLLHRKLLPGHHMTSPSFLAPLFWCLSPQAGLALTLFCHSRPPMLLLHVPHSDTKCLCSYLLIHSLINSTVVLPPSSAFQVVHQQILVRCSINFCQKNKFTIMKNSLRFLLGSKSLKMKALFYFDLLN